jgi:preprotein translocase subunit YajC
MTAQLLFPLLLVALLVPMFLGVRRQKREAEKVAGMQRELKVGDRVTTTSGLYGTVVEADETTVDLEIAEDVVTTWLRAAIREVRTDAAETESTGDGATGHGAVNGGSPDLGTGVTTPSDSAEPAEPEPAEPAGTVVEESAEDTVTRLSKD